MKNQTIYSLISSHGSARGAKNLMMTITLVKLGISNIIPIEISKNKIEKNERNFKIYVVRNFRDEFKYCHIKWSKFDSFLCSNDLRKIQVVIFLLRSRKYLKIYSHKNKYLLYAFEHT